MKKKPKVSSFSPGNNVTSQDLVTVPLDELDGEPTKGGGDKWLLRDALNRMISMATFLSTQVTHLEKTDWRFQLPFIFYSEGYLPLSCVGSDYIV